MEGAEEILQITVKEADEDERWEAKDGVDKIRHKPAEKKPPEKEITCFTLGLGNLDPIYTNTRAQFRF